ncbi:MAG: DUF4349 domain-containing protein [Candidatus Nanohaloarchaea archaeon]
MIEELRSGTGNRYLIVAAILGLALATGLVAQFVGNADAGIMAVQDRKLAGAGGSPVALDYGSSSSTQPVESERKKVTRYFIDLEVPEVERALDRTRNLAEEHGGFVKSASFDRENGDRGHLEVAVPDSNVSEFLDSLEESWRVESSRKTVEDVTDSYTQLKLELENRRQELQQLEELMNRTDSVENTIKIQERMSELRSRIQYLENQLSDLEQRVEYTTISISFEEPQPITHEFELRESLRKSYRGIFASLDLMIVGLGYLLPFLLLGGLVYKGRNMWREREQPE